MQLNFAGKAIIHADGVDFSNGQSFKINMAEMDLQEEIGRGLFMYPFVWLALTLALHAFRPVRRRR